MSHLKKFHKWLHQQGSHSLLNKFSAQTSLTKISLKLTFQSLPLWICQKRTRLWICLKRTQSLSNFYKNALTAFLKGTLSKPVSAKGSIKIAQSWTSDATPLTNLAKMDLKMSSKRNHGGALQILIVRIKKNLYCALWNTLTVLIEVGMILLTLAAILAWSKTKLWHALGN